MSVVLIDKLTKEVAGILLNDITDEQAESFCESWGWNYDDGISSYWLDVLEEYQDE